MQLPNNQILKTLMGNDMKIGTLTPLLLSLVAPTIVYATGDSSDTKKPVSDEVISEQRQTLAKATANMGFGPQSPRDIGSTTGNNSRVFGSAPDYSQMSLCNIHFHKNAEHKGGEFSNFAGNGNGEGYQSGFVYSGTLTEAELQPVDVQICPSEHSEIFPGDTLEVHYVYSTAKIAPGPTLGACLSESINNPQLRVETQVYGAVNDSNALDFGALTKHDVIGELPQAVNIPNNTGTPVQYAGSTTGPGYNEKGSPFEVTWSVRPKVAKVNIATVGEWCKGNVFKEDHGHGVRNLVVNPDLLSQIE